MKKLLTIILFLTICLSLQAQSGPTPKVFVDSTSISDGSITTSKIESGYNLLTDAEKSEALTTTFTQFTPTVSPTSGTLTSYTASGTYWVHDDVLYVNYYIHIVDAGTAGGVLLVTLPNSYKSARDVSLSCRENSFYSVPGDARAGAGGGSIALTKIDTSSPFVTGYKWVINGMMEKQ